ncbi:MAG: dTDP-glucose 4,6-dehydratase [Leptospirales bacterium]
MKNLLITGGCGFIGSNLLLHLHEKYPDYQLLNLDKLTYAADPKHLSGIDSSERYTFLQADISNFSQVADIFKNYDIEGVIHLAAESHVDNSIESPDEFVHTNVNGTFNMLKAVYLNWMDAPGQTKKGYEHRRFHHVSTDEVYGSLGETGLFTESTPYAPNSPYSATKAASDMLVRSYFHTYGLNTVITNCSNNFGPRQHTEKLIPVIIRKAVAEEPIPIYGDGSNVRDWLYVRDHCTALDLSFHKGIAGETYNIGGDNEMSNNRVAKYVCDILDELQPRKNGRSYNELIAFVKDRPGHDWRYAIDSTKINNDLGWRTLEKFEENLAETIKYYI